jgi:hypothetical protein
MTVDMILAISHNQITKVRCRVRLESKNNSESSKNIVDNIVDNIVYEKHVDNAMTNEKNKQQSCLEMFSLW